MKDRYEFLEILKFSPLEWELFSENAHLAVFNEKRKFEMERIDYALLIKEGETLLGYLTAREFDADSVYWQYGGCFPTSLDSFKAVHCYEKFLEWTRAQHYKRITTLIENDNIRYMKLAMKFGFKVIGVRLFEGKVLVEFLNDLLKEPQNAC